MSRPHAEPSARERAQAEAQAAQRRRDRRILAIVAAAIVIVLVAGGIGFQAWRSSRQPTADPGPTQSSEAPVTLRSGQPVVFGSADAPVQLSLYADFHCPHCVEFEDQYGPVLTDAQAQGKAAQRVYPMAFIDAGSATAANAFGCAAQSGFGQVYFNGLFENHTLEWNDEQLVSLAEQVHGSAPAEFSSCVKQRSNAAWVESINAAAEAAGVSSTPTLFLGDAPVDIANVTPEQLRDMIDKAATS